ncbi:MAG: FAD-dependent oxidoreductase [Propionibacteriaceae bacterium]|nr:FAD-dependent oxidoreductase [Propionibacteriaceae bacterium]
MTSTTPDGSPAPTLTVDLLVIGWGKAGKTLAGRFAAQGRTVALVERSPTMYGGTCINIACVPTKDLITSAEARREDDDPSAYFARSVAERDALIDKLNAANHAMLADRETVTLIDGTARFVGPREVVVETEDGEVRVSGEHVVVGTGATPRPLPVPGADSDRVYDSTTIQHADPFPERLAVVGGGFIGLEFASMFTGFGSKVTVLDAGDELLPRLDRDVAEAVSRSFDDRGIEVRHGVEVQEIVETDAGVRVVTNGGDVEADAVLVAIGRVPATKDLGLGEAGIETDDRGMVVVDDQLRTSVDGVFAVGDINGGPQFTYISMDDNRIVGDALLGEGRRRRSDRVAVPNTTFLTPPLSTVGLSEADAREEGKDVRIAAKPVAKIAAMPRPKIVGETHGLIKFVVEAGTEKILGATLFCIDSQELVNMVALAIRLGATVSDLRDGIWTHPSSTEAFNEVLGELS